MTKPNKFNYNTNYMSMGQIREPQEFDISVPQAAYPVEGGIIYPKIDTINLNVQAVDGSLDEFIIEYNGVKYSGACFSRTEIVEDGDWFDIILHRNSRFNVRVTIVRVHRVASVYVPDPAPAISAKVRVTSFKPPNIT